MPGATTASDVFFCAAIAVKLFMMPHTVPNRPTNGAVDPTLARNGRYFSSRSSSRPTVTDITRSMRCCRLARDAVGLATLAAERRHSRIAAANTADIGSTGRLPTRSYRSSRLPPDQNESSKSSA